MSVLRQSVDNLQIFLFIGPLARFDGRAGEAEPGALVPPVEVQGQRVPDAGLTVGQDGGLDPLDLLGRKTAVVENLSSQTGAGDLMGRAAGQFLVAADVVEQGGGVQENSPKLEGEDDLYEMFFASLDQPGIPDAK